ncbi:hypothetical protein BELL_0241g00050 [Botrytis elliptica]|uniref:Uncharacterized protein n=1 Tax=Botrytis elliptica TaxID=278938 RepID=A0A4Z1JNU2_9HELO|nr:hypothetical protein EAE99_009549 [Botrytis elliptica]TGO75004.1 hypothetical protein BELL_0241g00050 [Botrytis elliptica]
MPILNALLLGAIIVSNFLFDFGISTSIGRFCNNFAFARLVFILLAVLEIIMLIPEILRAPITASIVMIEIYAQTIKIHTMNTKSLAAIDKNGLPLIPHGPERQKLQSLQKYSLFVAKIALADSAIFLGTIGVIIIASAIRFVSALLNATGTL